MVLVTPGPRMLWVTNLNDVGGEVVSTLLNRETPRPKTERFLRNCSRHAAGEGCGGPTTTAETSSPEGSTELEECKAGSFSASNSAFRFAIHHELGRQIGKHKRRK